MRFASPAHFRKFVSISMLVTFAARCRSNSSALLLPRSRVTDIILSGIFLAAGARAYVPPFGNDKSASSDAEKMSSGKASKTLRVLLNGGDNMLGRAIQLSFPVQSPGEEEIRDSCPASHYLNMCLHPSGSQDLSVDEIRKLNSEGSYLWGDYLSTKIDPPPDLRILNFESAITRSIKNHDVPNWKGIRYHFHVDNLEPAMRAFAETTHGGNAASPVVLSFANNHCMDYGRKAFESETLPALAASSSLFETVGAGIDWTEATEPALVDCGDVAVEVFAFSSGCSGTPELWWARKDRSGLVGLPGIYSERAVEDAVKIVKEAIGAHGELVPAQPKNRLRIASIHWGPNWALKGESEDEIAARRKFGHRLIDECGVDLIYGHSSHHCRGMESHNGKLILYGTGDMINDYEGFENRGEEKYNKLGGIYVVDLEKSTGKFQQLRIIPTFMNRLRLERYNKESKMWKPNARRLEVDPSKSEHLASFLNKLSVGDAGGKAGALMVKHEYDDPEIPGGPVLISEKLLSEAAA